MWFIGVEIEQETSAHPPQKNPGSAPEVVPCKSIRRKVSFKWSHHRFSSTDSKVRTTLQNSFFHPGSERVNTVWNRSFKEISTGRTNGSILFLSGGFIAAKIAPKYSWGNETVY